MTGSKGQKLAKADIDVVFAEFKAKENLLAELCAKTKSLIEAILQDANIRYQSLQARVKSEEKLKEKYLDPTKDYRGLREITDLAGLRIITYYEDDVDRAAEVIRREFDVDPENSIDKRAREPDRFGYNAINYVCTHLERRTSSVEYKKFSNLCCEIQITSILSHAWAEMEHEWYDRRQGYPDAIKRKFSRLAALLEFAESGFLDIRTSRAQYERSVSVRVEAKVFDLQVDPVSIRSFIEQEPLVAEIDQAISSALGKPLSTNTLDRWIERTSISATFAGLLTLNDLRESLSKNRKAIPEYVLRSRELRRPSDPKTRLFRGLSIFHLAHFLVNLQGQGKTLQLLADLKIDPTWDVARQLTIAKEVAAKYKS